MQSQKSSRGITSSGVYFPRYALTPISIYGRNSVEDLVQDKCWSLYVGRDQGIRAPHYDVSEPQIDTKMDSAPWTWTFPTKSAAGGVQRVPYSQDSNLSRAFVLQVDLMKIAAAIMDEVYSMRSTSKRNGGGISLSRVQDLQCVFLSL